MADAAAASQRAVWFVTRKYPPAVGGMERLSYELTTRIAQRRPATIVALRGSPWRLPWFVVASALRVAAAARSRRIAVLHLGDPVLAPVGWLARRLRVPVCVTVHGLDVTYDHLAYRAWLRLFFRDFDAYVCISSVARDAAIAHGVPTARTVQVGIGIDPPPALPTQPRDPDLLLFVGRLVARKGLAWFVEEVLPRVRARRPAVRLVAIGEGPERERVRTAAQRAGVAAIVTLAGAVDEATKQQWLARAAVCVMPNVPVAGDLEGYGIAALEAAAAACPLVAADLEGLRDAIDAGEGGMLVAARAADAWSDAVVALLSDTERAQRLGFAARAWALRERTWERVCDAYEQVFARIATT